MKTFLTLALLVIANVFMTFAWYGHIVFKQMSFLQKAGVFSIILISWGLAFFEYCFQVPANRIGHESHGGPFNLVQLKTLQEAITLIVFAMMTTLVFKTDKLSWNHFVGFGLMVLAVFFVFKKW